jgi:Phage integrase family
MLKADLAAVGIAYEDEQGRVLDFHALRHTFITNLRHAPSRVAQKLARHKSSAMTDRYTHIRLHDERAALDLLPDLTVPAESEAAKKTGTDDGPVDETKKPTSDVRKSGAPYGALWGANGRIGSEAGAKANRTPGIGNAVSEWARLDSNQRPTHYECAALTAELRARRRGAIVSRLGQSLPSEWAGCKDFWPGWALGPDTRRGADGVDFGATVRYR